MIEKTVTISQQAGIGMPMSSVSPAFPRVRALPTMTDADFAHAAGSKCALTTPIAAAYAGGTGVGADGVIADTAKGAFLGPYAWRPPT